MKTSRGYYMLMAALVAAGLLGFAVAYPSGRALLAVPFVFGGVFGFLLRWSLSGPGDP